MKYQTNKTNSDNYLFSADTVFKNLTKEEIKLLPFDNAPLEFKKGTIIYKENSRLSGFYLIKTGIIKVYKTGFDGKEQIIRFARKNEIIGFRSVLSHELACTTAKVLDTTEIYYIPSDMLFYLIKSNGNFALDLLQLTCHELEESNKYITDIAQKTVKERIAEVLLHLNDTFSLDNDNILKINLTREEIANIVGTATESVIRLLSDMKNEGYIDLVGRKIKLKDIPRLKKLAGFIIN